MGLSLLRGIVQRCKAYITAKPDGKKQKEGIAARKDFPWLVFGGSFMSFSAGWVSSRTSHQSTLPRACI